MKLSTSGNTETITVDADPLDRYNASHIYVSCAGLNTKGSSFWNSEQTFGYEGEPIAFTQGVTGNAPQWRRGGAARHPGDPGRVVLLGEFGEIAHRRRRRVAGADDKHRLVEVVHCTRGEGQGRVIGTGRRVDEGAVLENVGGCFVVEHLPAGERSDLLGNYYRRLTDRDPDKHRPASRAWSRYEAACSTLYPTARAPFESDHGGFALALSRIEAHYFANGTFVPEGWPWNEIDRVRSLPCTIVQGRYDIVCPPVTAEALARAWPEARYIVVPDAGHSALEPGIRSALVNATESYRLSLTDDDLFAPRFPWETG